MNTLKKIFANKVRCEVNSVVTTVEIRVQVLTAKGSLVITRVELAMESVNASSGQCVDGVVLDPDQRVSSGIVEGLQMTASTRINFHTEINRFDETRGSNTVGGDELPVNESDFDCPTHTPHSIFVQRFVSASRFLTVVLPLIGIFNFMIRWPSLFHSRLKIDGDSNVNPCKSNGGQYS